MLRKSAKRPRPWLLSCAKADTKRLRSAVESALAFFRTRTIAATEPTRAAPLRAWIVTSPLPALGFPNLPAAKNGTVVPLVGTGRVTLLENTTVVPLRNTTTPPPAADTAVIFRLTVGDGAPAGLVTRVRQGDGAQGTKRAVGLALLLICSSTSIVVPPEAGDLSGILLSSGVAIRSLC